MLDLLIAVGTLSRSQINNDRGSLIAIYEPQSSWERISNQLHLNCLSAKLAQMYEVSKVSLTLGLLLSSDLCTKANRSK